MKISVVLTTCRWGGFDVLHHCMANQTMSRSDFEIVVVDELYAKRPDALKLYNLNVKHIPPDKESEVYNNTACFNAALRRAEGELICFAIDFMWMYPRYLDDHWAYYKQTPGWSMTGFIDRYEFPPLDAPEEQNEYMIFEEPFDSRFAANWFKKNKPVYRERKGGAGIIHPDGTVEMPGNKIYLIPDSIPLAVLKALNGLDEIFDGGYGVADIDCGVRANLLGWHFGLNPNCLVQKLGTPELSAKIPGVKKPKTKSWEENFKIFQRRMENIKNGKEEIAVPAGRGAWS